MRRFPGYDSRAPEPADWRRYGPCPRCQAKAGEPCRDLRWRYGASTPKPGLTYKPHESRPLITEGDMSADLHRPVLPTSTSAENPRPETAREERNARARHRALEAAVGLRVEPGQQVLILLNARQEDGVCERLAQELREMYPGVGFAVLDEVQGALIMPNLAPVQVKLT